MARIRLVPPKQVIQRGSTDVFAVDEPTLAAVACGSFTGTRAIRAVSKMLCAGCFQQPSAGLNVTFCHARLGQSPHERIVQVRMAKAKAYLLNTAKAITEISAECGYAGRAKFRGRVQEASGGETPWGLTAGRNRLEHGFRCQTLTRQEASSLRPFMPSCTLPCAQENSQIDEATLLKSIRDYPHPNAFSHLWKKVLNFYDRSDDVWLFLWKCDVKRAFRL